MISKIKRFERKWIFRNGNYLSLINALIRSKLYFEPHFPKRHVNSIYFDDNKYSSVIENLDGVSNKKKFRVRWYGNQKIINNPIFEIKSKRGFETKKTSNKINELKNLKFPNMENLEFIKNTVNKKLNLKKTIYPLLTTAYEREYFISHDRKIRATIDYNLKSIFLKNMSQLDIIKNFNSICILEIKYSTKLDKYVRGNLKDITLRLSKNSKFVNSAFDIPKFYS